jgi:hypothetical protein
MDLFRYSVVDKVAILQKPTGLGILFCMVCRLPEFGIVDDGTKKCDGAFALRFEDVFHRKLLSTGSEH